MPPKRKSTGPRTASQRQQSTLPFSGKNSKVTKPTSPRNAKASKKDPALLEKLTNEDAKAEAEPDLEEPTTAEAAIEEQAKAEVDPLAAEVKTEDVLGGRAEEGDAGAIGGRDGSGWVSDEAERARKIPATQINKYWRAKEQERKAPRVHQQDLTVSEKILREWDMSNQYGVSSRWSIRSCGRSADKSDYSQR